MKKLHIGIIGSRRRDTLTDGIAILKAFFLEAVGPNWYLHGNPKLNDVVIVSGGCKKGGDKIARIIYDVYKPTHPGLELLEHLPKLEGLTSNTIYKWLYREACYKRNELIARDSDILIACVYPDRDNTNRSGGTEHTIKCFCDFHNNTRKLVLV